MVGRIGADEPPLAGIARGGQLTEGRRRAILEHAVARYVEHGYEVESDTGRQAVVAKQQRVSVLRNLLLTPTTGGLRLIVLAIRLLDRPTDRAVLTVTESEERQGEFSS